jgi:hypothetical protein
MPSTTSGGQRNVAGAMPPGGVNVGEAVAGGGLVAGGAEAECAGAIRRKALLRPTRAVGGPNPPARVALRYHTHRSCELLHVPILCCTLHRYFHALSSQMAAATGRLTPMLAHSSPHSRRDACFLTPKRLAGRFSL